ncbi:MAG: nucleotidyltransferase domain-containing protein [Candidatus Uhrbacteria bacterium]
MAQRRIPKRIVNTVRNYRKRLEEDAVFVERILVYGSHAKGTAREQSDIDVCVISPSFSDPISALAFLLKRRNQAEVLAGLEPVGFTPKDFREGSSLINEIKRTGIPVN